jgi:hypothetical protein
MCQARTAKGSVESLTSAQLSMLLEGIERSGAMKASSTTRHSSRRNGRRSRGPVGGHRTASHSTIFAWPVRKPIRFNDAAMCASSQRPAMLPPTASSEVLHLCSSVLSFLTRDHEHDFAVASSTSAMMSLIRARTRRWRPRMVVVGAAQAAERSAAMNPGM